MLREEKIWDITPNVKIVKIEMAKNYQEGVEWKLEKGRREEEWQASKDGIGLSWAAKEKQIPAGFKTIKLDLVQQSLVKKNDTIWNNFCTKHRYPERKKELETPEKRTHQKLPTKVNWALD